MREASCRKSRAIKKCPLLLVAFVAGCAHTAVPALNNLAVENLTQTYGWTQVNLSHQVMPGQDSLAPDGNIYGYINLKTTYGVAQVTPQGIVTGYAISGAPSFTAEKWITPNPNGDIYAIEEFGCLGSCNPTFDIARLSEGTITETQLPFTQTGDYPYGIVSGSDGNLWIVHLYGVAKLTTQGQWTDYTGQTFKGAATSDIARGPDKNVWVLAVSDGNNLLTKVNVTDGSFTSYAAPSDAQGLVQGADKNLYALGTNKVYSITTNGTFTPYAVTPNPAKYAVATSGRLWWVAAKNVAFAWSTRTHKIALRFDVPGACRSHLCTIGFVNGPGGNFWAFQNTGNIAQVLAHPQP